MADERDERIGMVGPGRMGLAMTRHLIAAGYRVTATDVSAERLAAAEAAGAATAADAAGVGAASDYAIVAVGYDDETRAVTMGADGLIAGMAPGGVIAICSTASPYGVRDIAAAAGARGIDVLDAPICRGRWAADEGALLALVGGTDEVVRRSRPILETFCSDVAYLGDVGHGQLGKAMNNFLLWINGIGLLEAGRLAESFGADLPRLRRALLIGSGRSAALEDWDRITFTWALKDMQIVSELCDEAGLSLPVAGAVRELVKEARRVKAADPPDWTGKGATPARPPVSRAIPPTGSGRHRRRR